MLTRWPNLLNAPDEQGLTPLQRAALVPGASPEAEEVADLLMRLGATVDIWTACTFGRLDDVKAALEKDPSLVNQDPYGKGWMIKIKLAPGAKLDHLLDLQQYEKQIAEGH